MSKTLYLFVLLILLPFNGITSDSTAFILGQKLFRKNCANCHNVHKELTGPMLASITKKRPQEWLISFIRNSQNVILSNDPDAYFLFSQYNRTVMPSFQQFSDVDIKNILHYIEIESKVRQAPPNEELNYLPGKELFKNHCLTCHQLNSEDYGPSLGSVYRRRPLPWIIKFVTNSQGTIKGGDKYADSLFNKFDKKVMPSFYFLDKQSIIDIVQYIDVASKSSPQVAGVNGNTLHIEYKADPISSFRFADSEPTNEDHGVFGDIIMGVIFFIGGYIYFIVIKKLYLYLFKSQE